MADLQALRDEFVAAFEAGEDPKLNAWLQRVGEAERQELEELIDQYLMTAPRRAWDPVGYESSLAKVAVERVLESREGVSGNWPELLPSLRNRARIKRQELVRRLAEALGVGGTPADLEQVGVYYNRMEHGALEAEGVSARVLDALAGIVGSTAEALRRAGAGIVQPDAGSGPAFARMASPAPDYLLERAALEATGDAFADEDMPAPPASPGTTSARERIDELFTGG